MNLLVFAKDFNGNIFMVGKEVACESVLFEHSVSNATE
jgi:hypothetical protein